MPSSTLDDLADAYTQVSSRNQLILEALRAHRATVSETWNRLHRLEGCGCHLSALRRARLEAHCGCRSVGP